MTFSSIVQQNGRIGKESEDKNSGRKRIGRRIGIRSNLFTIPRSLLLLNFFSFRSLSESFFPRFGLFDFSDSQPSFADGGDGEGGGKGIRAAFRLKSSS